MPVFVYLHQPTGNDAMHTRCTVPINYLLYHTLHAWWSYSRQHIAQYDRRMLRYLQHACSCDNPWVHLVLPAVMSINTLTSTDMRQNRRLAPANCGSSSGIGSIYKADSFPPIDINPLDGVALLHPTCSLRKRG